MLAPRYVALVALAVWIGGLIALGAIAAPSAFDVLTTRHGADGRVLAGTVFAEMLRRFHRISYACAIIVLGSLALRAVLGPRPVRFAVRLAIATAMLAVTLYSGRVLSPHLERVQDTIGVSPSSLPADDARRIEFSRLHARSTLLQMVPLMGGLLLMVWELKG
jgi:hypothetical protein